MACHSSDRDTPDWTTEEQRYPLAGQSLPFKEEMNSKVPLGLIFIHKVLSQCHHTSESTTKFWLHVDDVTTKYEFARF